MAWVGMPAACPSSWWRRGEVSRMCPPAEPGLVWRWEGWAGVPFQPGAGRPVAILSSAGQSQPGPGSGSPSREPWGCMGALVLGSTGKSCLCCSLQHDFCNGCSNCRHLVAHAPRSGRRSLGWHPAVGWARAPESWGSVAAGGVNPQPKHSPASGTAGEAPASQGGAVVPWCVPSPPSPLPPVNTAMSLWAQL